MFQQGGFSASLYAVLVSITFFRLLTLYRRTYQEPGKKRHRQGSLILPLPLCQPLLGCIRDRIGEGVCTGIDDHSACRSGIVAIVYFSVRGRESLDPCVKCPPAHFIPGPNPALTLGTNLAPPAVPKVYVAGWHSSVVMLHSP